MEIANKNIYLSHPYTGCEQLAKGIAKKYKELLMMRGANSVWSPTEEIPDTASWQEAMDICEAELTSGRIEGVVVLNIIDPERNKLEGQSLTLNSKGVKYECLLAMQNGIPIEVVPIKLSTARPSGKKIWVCIKERFKTFANIFGNIEPSI